MCDLHLSALSICLSLPAALSIRVIFPLRPTMVIMMVVKGLALLADGGYAGDVL